jgi:hypothetical protein
MEVCQRNADASERRPYQRMMNDLRILKVGTAVPSRPFGGSGMSVNFANTTLVLLRNRYLPLRRAYSTVTLLARLRGLSTSHPRATAM